MYLRNTRPVRRKRWIRVAALYCMFLYAMCYSALADEGLQEALWASAYAFAGLGYLDATPPSTSLVGYQSADETFDFSSARATAALNGLLTAGVSTTAALQAAIDTAVPGSYIELASGTLSIGSIDIAVSGTSAAPIVIAGRGGSIPNLPTVINRASTLTFYTVNQSWIVLGQFRIQGGSGRGFAWKTCRDIRLSKIHTHNITADKTNQYSIIELYNNCRRVDTDHCFFYSDTTKDSSGNFMYAAAWRDYGNETDYNNNWWNADCEFHHNTITGRAYGCAVWVYQGDFWRGGLPAEMSRRNANLRCEYNHIYSYGGDLDGWVQIKRDQVTIRFNRMEDLRNSANIHWRDSNRTVVAYNYFANFNATSAGSLMVEIGGQDATVIGNIFVQTSGVVRACISFNNNWGYRDLYLGGIRDRWSWVPQNKNITIAHNTFIASDQHIYQSSQNRGAFIYVDFETVSGTPLIVSPIAGVVPDKPPSQFPAGTARTSGRTENVKVINNIFSITQTSGGTTANVRAWYDHNTALTMPGTYGEANVYYKQGTATYGNGHDKYETRGIYGDPLLGAGHMPGASSPARGAGVYTTVTQTDYYGNVFSSPRTIGAVSANVAVETVISSSPSAGRLSMIGRSVQSTIQPIRSSAPSSGKLRLLGGRVASNYGKTFHVSTGELRLIGLAMHTITAPETGKLYLLGGVLSGQTVGWSAVDERSDQWTEL